MDALPQAPPPAIEQPASYQASFGLVTGIAPRGTRRVLVYAAGRELADKKLRGRRFTLRIPLPTGDVTVKVVTVGAKGRSAAVVPNVYGLPASARPRTALSRNDPVLARNLRSLLRRYSGSSAAYVQNLGEGRGAAWNARARFPAASTLKLAIAAAVLTELQGIPAPSSHVGSLLREMILPSDDAAANALLVWLAGSTSAGGRQVNALMSSIGMKDSLMYGGYETTRSVSARIPVRIDDQPSWGIGKYTTAYDLASLHRAIWLAAGGQGPLRRGATGITAADGRHLLWLLAHVRDTPKLDMSVKQSRDVVVLHKAGWINAARHDAGLVFWRGGVFVVSVMTWSRYGAGPSSDRLAGRCAQVALDRFRSRHG